MNKELLEYEMKIRKINKEKMCKHLGISRSAFYRKSNSLSEFTLTEIQTMLSLGLPSYIFFS